MNCRSYQDVSYDLLSVQSPGRIVQPRESERRSVLKLGKKDVDVPLKHVYAQSPVAGGQAEHCEDYK